MNIPDHVLAEAYETFGARQTRSFTDSDIQALVSFIVERSIDYEALADFLTGRLFGLRTRDGAMRGAHAAMHAALGIGGDDEP